MAIYLAPMEGVTTHIYRKLLNKYYPGVDKYFTPFISPNQTKSFQMKELEELDIEKNAGMLTVPQLMCNNPEHFIWAAKEVADRGYKEVNFNLGCPSKTVVTKKKGSGFLAYPDELDRFFDAVCPRIDTLGIKLSVKSRLGRNNPDEFVRILDIYNQYPITELILHSRIQSDFYKGPVRYEWLDYAYKNCRLPLCINGDIYTTEDILSTKEKYPAACNLMLGRGIIARPYLFTDGDILKDKSRFTLFHNELLDYYISRVSGDFSILCKMKELWYYMLPVLINPDEIDKYQKEMRKVTKVTEYGSLVDRIVSSV